MAEQKFQVKCGFFDSIDNDRLYSADEMNRPYKRLITNGVFATQNGMPSTDLQVFANEGMTVTVKKGEGIFGDKWFENPSDLLVTVSANTDIVSRIDSIIVQVDKLQNGRVGNVVYRMGEPNSTPTPPIINDIENIIEYRIANIRVNPTTQQITQDLITDLRGSDECKWVTSIINQVDTSTLYEQWQTAYQKYYDNETEAFNAFMENLTGQLTVNTNLVKYESHYSTTDDGETIIPINITTYNKNKDVLVVRVNRLFASEISDYVISDDSSSIILNKGLTKEQNVDFLVLQSVIVGNTETVLQEISKMQAEVTLLTNEVQELRNIVNNI